MVFIVGPTYTVLVHAVNSQGVWGSGIAKKFKELYPHSFQEYNAVCTLRQNHNFYETAKENSRKVGCLFTSKNYGNLKDSKDVILYNTVLALEELGSLDNGGHYYSNKFNSGLFGVPWEETEKILAVAVQKFNLDWTVCEYE